VWQREHPCHVKQVAKGYTGETTVYHVGIISEVRIISFIWNMIYIFEQDNRDDGTLGHCMVFSKISAGKLEWESPSSPSVKAISGANFSFSGMLTI
jgi:hypothetical protein